MIKKSIWISPSFTGGVLPGKHIANDETVEGFEAKWAVPYLARNILRSGAYLDLAEVGARDRNDLAARPINAANPYQSVERALKYAVTFLLASFFSAIFFLRLRPTRWPTQRNMFWWDCPSRISTCYY